MPQHLFRIFVHNQQSAKAESLLHTLQQYVGLKDLAAVDEIQGYDLCVETPEGLSGTEPVARFSALHLADPVCDRHLIQPFPAGSAGTESSTAAAACLPLLSVQTENDSKPSFLAYETPAAQFDPRARAVQDCWKLWAQNPYPDVQLLSVRCFWLYALASKPKQQNPQNGDGLRKTDLDAAHQYLWTPLELQVKNLNRFSYSARRQADFQTRANVPQGKAPLPSLLALQPETSPLRAWADQIGLRFDDATLAYIQAYYSRQTLPGLASVPSPLIRQNHEDDKRKVPPREPTLTELRILEAYWSDHCRHTTFHTELNWPEELAEESGKPGSDLPQELQQAWQLYQDLRRQCQTEQKTQCLMDIAVMGARTLKTLQGGPYQSNLYMDAVEVSAEVNACSVFVDVPDDANRQQKRLLMFKNETHNHPTEIEPYGGAATCLGGAIRDPLSGRSYIYQALRLSGAASPNQNLDQVRPGKLPQRKIATDAARGFSDYGNRIGLAGDLVVEIYHPGFEAKRFECGMVVGVAQPEQVKRLEPRPGDLILLLGGATGRDGIGGASGSSAAHDSDTVTNNSAEVQRGNPAEERKLQRFFRRSDVGHLIKRCNDFGAGGVAVAVGEIAASLTIELAAMPTKYEGLSPDELAVSESQERMAVVIDAADRDTFLSKAESEGICTIQLGQVTRQSSDETATFRLLYNGVPVAELARDFLDSSGFPRRADIQFAGEHLQAYTPEAFSKAWRSAAEITSETQSKTEPETQLCKILSHPQIASQRGLQHQFDSSVGAGTIFQPYPCYTRPSHANPGDDNPSHTNPGESRTYSRSEVSARLIPLYFQSRQTETAEQYPQGNARHASLISFGYDVHLSSRNIFLGSQVAIVQSAAKLMVAGVQRCHIYLSLQEYFPRPETPELWGQVSAALLGALQAQHRLGLAAIGGKDSMSGTFEELKVPPVLSSFAFGTAPCTALRASNWQQNARHLYLLGQPQPGSRPLQNPDYERIRAYWQYLEELSAPDRQHGGTDNSPISGRLVGAEGILAATTLFSFGSAPKRIILRSYDPTYLQPYAADPSFSALLLASSAPLPQNPYLRELASLEDCSLNQEAMLLPDGLEMSLNATSPLYRAWSSAETEPGYYPTEAERPAGERQNRLLQEALQKDLQEDLQETLPAQNSEARTGPQTWAGRRSGAAKQKIRLVVPVFPGSNSEDDMLYSFAMAAKKLGCATQLELSSPVLNLLDKNYIQQSLEQLAELLKETQILALPGGFSAGDEPDGSAKFIASVLREPQIAAAIDRLLSGKGLILGICNGFQALIKSGLLPYGQDWQQGASYGREDLSITHNRQNRHIADLELCRVCPTHSPWLQGMSGKDYLVPISHGEGRLVMPQTLFERLHRQRQVAAVYHEDVNGSFAGIEALCSTDGRILGKMAHSERCGPQLYRNMPHDPDRVSLQQDIFANGLQYFL
ncbi:phosphoribosylformylglycinamidine synthase subunit PurQ [Candidatus Haliotispira prima]|uniref:Phosphoribosylformylglycinamidine synthase subunit PurQ n=1 Tax=Candidatus Haliotispira prima TaxID=3034016 RepID=A0ABY8MM72_9SPIO|nr:phosphoribosylformylglycinamidine synthase subunit PurQ [Candidatus Haliotispira prima]